MLEQRLRGFFAPDIEIGGGRPQDIQVHDPRFYARVLLRGFTGLGESYVDGWWDCDALDQMYAAAIRLDLFGKLKHAPDVMWLSLKEKLFNLQSPARAAIVAERHYDLGNDLFRAMLDKRMIYTCAYWKEAATLDQAQEAKLELICRKLRLQPGMRVLDIGCGWGGFAKYAAERYGVEVVGITVSKEQVELARRECAGLPVEIRFQDYREVDERFDRVVSIGMFEAVGPKNFGAFFRAVHRCLAPDSLFLLHTIGRNDDRCLAAAPWMTKHIFPNGVLPLPAEIARGVEGLFDLLDWHEFGAYYDPTLMAWTANFEAHWPRLRQRYDERFRRMWRHYLLLCAGGFRARLLGLWQVVLGKRWTRPYEGAR